MASRAAAWLRAGAGATLALASVGAVAQGFVPPAGYGGKPGPAVAMTAEPGAPALTRIPDASLADLFRVDPAYPRADHAHVKVIGAYAVAEPRRTRLVAAWGQGFLPVTLSFSDGRCFSFSADYVGGILSNGRLTRTGCEHRPNFEPQPPAPPPPGRTLRLVGSGWGFDAWADDKAGTTLVTVPFAKTFEPFFTTRMPVTAIMAMNGIDWPGGNVTLVGRIHGRVTIVTLEVGY
jgi:hypothetical protein